MMDRRCPSQWKHVDVLRSNETIFFDQARVEKFSKKNVHTNYIGNSPNLVP